jgi:hypothetical protein
MSPEVLSPEIHAARYDMDALEANRMCTDFLDRTQDTVKESRLGCYKFESSSKEANLGRYVESTVFYETFGNDPILMDQEYGPYEHSSDFYVVVDHEEKMPVGVMRIIKNSGAGLKSLNDIKDTPLEFTDEDVCAAYGIDKDRCIDIATLAIVPEYRGPKAEGIPSLLMYRTLFLNVLNNPDYTHVVTIIDEKAERNLRTFKFPFEPVFDSDYFSYLDSARSRLLMAQNDQFYPYVTMWADRYCANADGSSIKQWIGTTMSSLVDQGVGPLDDMLAESCKQR